MGRERKNIISLDVDSALALMQEIYNDIVEQKNTINGRFSCENQGI